MTKTLVNKWVKALRSGNYKQGRTFLRQSTPEGDCFCVLGVLADVAGCRWGKEKIPNGPEVGTLGLYQSFGILPESIGKRIGISNNAQVLLTTRNDVQHWKFDTIASYIEKNWKQF